MRQINADELIELIDNYIKTADHTDRSALFVDGMKDGYYRIRNKILNMPSEPSEIIHCRDCKHYYFADNRIPQEQRYMCDIGGEIWQPDDYCSYAERRGKRMDEIKTIKLITDIKPQITRACEICGDYTDRIEDHICRHCRKALFSIIHNSEYGKG